MLQHLMGYLKNHLSSDDKQELLGLIEVYRQGPLNSSRASSCGNCRSRPTRGGGGFCQGARGWRAALNRYPVPDWVDQQVYLHPVSQESMLRNHV
ncbi:MAG TPA: DUF1722 domain-containing protein [Anaerolineae bacterium]|nr:DUF1722 domain-containing protein [Anaerolineae bacterium]